VATVSRTIATSDAICDRCSVASALALAALLRVASKFHLVWVRRRVAAAEMKRDETFAHMPAIGNHRRCLSLLAQDCARSALFAVPADL
jgi:hypothetical protein